MAILLLYVNEFINTILIDGVFLLSVYILFMLVFVEIFAVLYFNYLISALFYSYFILYCLNKSLFKFVLLRLFWRFLFWNLFWFLLLILLLFWLRNLFYFLFCFGFKFTFSFRVLFYFWKQIPFVSAVCFWNQNYIFILSLFLFLTIFIFLLVLFLFWVWFYFWKQILFLFVILFWNWNCIFLLEFYFVAIDLYFWFCFIFCMKVVIILQIYILVFTDQLWGSIQIGILFIESAFKNVSKGIFMFQKMFHFLVQTMFHWNFCFYIALFFGGFLVWTWHVQKKEKWIFVSKLSYFCFGCFSNMALFYCWYLVLFWPVFSVSI